MNPRLVEPGFAVVFLHADVPARPGKGENGEDDAQVARRHGRRQDTCAASRCARLARRVSGSNPMPPQNWTGPESPSVARQPWP